MYAYADDIAILIKDYRQAKKCIKLIESWSKSNSMEINKNKCGILTYNHARSTLTNKEINLFIEGIPIV